MQISEKNKPKNSFPFLWEEIEKRFMAPIGQVTFWVYLVFGILLLSACGIWIELGKYFFASCKSLDGIQTAICTFFPALACTATMQISFSDVGKKYLKSVGLAVGFMMLLGAVGLLVLNEHIPPAISLPIGVLFSIFAILTWWIANGLDPIFYDGAGEDPTIGGDVKKDLSGSVVGFKI